MDDLKAVCLTKFLNMEKNAKKNKIICKLPNYYAIKQRKHFK